MMEKRAFRDTCGGAEIIKLLLKHGADPKLKALDGKTALDYAIEFKNKEVQKTLSE